MLTFTDARQLVIREAQPHAGGRPVMTVPLATALGHILAQEVLADREYPPFHRSTRDGYAVRASEVGPGIPLRCVGEIKAGDPVSLTL